MCVMNLPISDKLKICLLPNLVKRLFRIGVFNILKYRDLRIIVLKKKILFLRANGSFHQIKIDRGSRPLKSGMSVLNGKLYYGDYWKNPYRVPAYIYEVDLNSFKKTIFYTLDWVRHIHLVQADKHKDNCILIGTGDSNSESGIYRLNVETRKLEVLGHGAQKYRAVSIVQTREKLFYGSDNPDGDNYIFEYDKSSGNAFALKKIDGPAYYSAVDNKNRIYIATTIEDRKRHRAIIYRSEDGGYSWQEYREFQKDIWPTKYFGYGVIEISTRQDSREGINYKLFGLKKI